MIAVLVLAIGAVLIAFLALAGTHTWVLVAVGGAAVAVAAIACVAFGRWP